MMIDHKWQGVFTLQNATLHKLLGLGPLQKFLI